MRDNLSNAVLFAIPGEDGRFLVDPAAGLVQLSGIPHQEQDWSRQKVLRLVNLLGKSSNFSQISYGAPQMDTYAPVTFLKLTPHLALPNFTLKNGKQT